MKFTLALTALVATGTLALASSLDATTVAHTNYLTFSAPFALPGVSLPAGTYVFETPLAPASLDVVRVTSRDGRHVYLTAFTQTVNRPANAKPAAPVIFGEVMEGRPAPVRIWYPVGERIGHAFIY